VEGDLKVDEQGRTERTDTPAERTGNPLIDVLSYPLSISGIIHLVIFSFLALLFPRALTKGYWMAPGIGHLFLLVVLTGYCLLYLTVCVRNSAAGERRAPDINLEPRAVNTDEILSSLFSTFAWAGFCVSPFLVYYIVTRQVDAIFWLLVAYSILFAPMSLLAVALFDSLWALNPVLVIGSVLRVFAPYVGMVLVFSLICGLIALLRSYSCLFALACAYLMMVMAHLLGRFYWWYQEKLRWEV
jgi:hypothetical protein